MNLHTNYPYALLKHGIPYGYPSLQTNIKTDVAIMGAGITGSLIAWHLAQQGIPCVVLDKRHAGMGSTAASTSLIQYELDTPLHQLVNMVGEKNAVKAYQLCVQAISDLEALCKQLKGEKLFERKCSLQYASSKSHVKALQEEYAIRKKHGFELDFLEEADIKKMFGFTAPAGLLSARGGQLEAYMLTHCLLNDIQRNGCPVFDKTDVISIEHNRNGVLLTTSDNATIKAKKLIIACGYESQRYLSKKVEKLYTTYAIVSEPLAQDKFWYQNCLIWETAHPYLYVRTTSENRILVGGKDTPYLSDRQQRKVLPAKASALEKSFSKLFPHLFFKTDFLWSGAFGSTKDGMPYIGSVAEHPNTYFALGYGGNGITFSLIAAKLISESVCGKKSANFDIFSFER